jgi:pseudomonalisin
MRLSVVLSTVAVTAAVVVQAPAAASAATGLDPVVVKGAIATGALDRAAVPVTIALAPRDKAGLAKAAARGGGLTPARFNARFAPAKSEVKAVRAWARANALKVASVSANRTLVRLTGSSAAVGKAFHTTLTTFKAPDGSTFFAPASRARLSGSLSGHVTSVLGLSNIGRTATSQLPLPLPTTGLTSYGPQDLATLYDAPASATGAGQALAVIAEGDLTQPRADLATFETQNGLPHVTWTQVTVGTPSSDTSGSDEWDLDTQYSTGLAPGVTDLRVYDGASLSNDDILATINRWVTDDATRQASFSAGECEVLAAATGFTDSLDTTLMQAAAQGQTLFVASGDTGIFCPPGVGVNGVPAGIPSVDYPASSPYAVGVGGTTVLGPGNEIAWYSGGGGVSYFESAPAFQTGVGGSFAGVNRGVPDVALDADPLSGYEVIVNGAEETIGGTSASAPAWQGLWARVQAARGGSLGFAADALYAAPASAFHDIVIGTNGAPATPGYDYATGRGTPDVAALIGG